MKKFIFATMFALGSVYLFTSPVVALADPLGKFRTYQITCTGTAARMIPTDDPRTFQAFKFWVNNATEVYMGGSDVTTTTKGLPYCTTAANCVAAYDSVDGNPAEFYCRTAGGSITVTVLAGRK